MKFCFVFVCQQGELEIKSLLLAASLQRFARCDHELRAAIPQPESIWGKPSSATLELFERLGVGTCGIENPIGPEYPIGNKLACLGIETDADKIIFLDSDMLCMREFHSDRRFEEFHVNAKPADLSTWAADLQQWQRAYATCGSEFPSYRVSSTVAGESMPPYFNAGFIAAHRSSDLAKVWAECARSIDADASIPDKRPWLDQIALPVALNKLALKVDCLDERFNYPAHIKPIASDNPPYFCHYHTPEVLCREPMANVLAQSLVNQHKSLQDIIEANPAWNGLLRRPAPKPPILSRVGNWLKDPTLRQMRTPRTLLPELIITGIPRSGTSYLCKLAHSAKNCVVINEPGEIFAPLSQQAAPWGVAIFYEELRRDILIGKPVSNKLVRGEFIEDTALVDALESYTPQVSRADFLLGTKNTLAYLARLPQLRRVMPQVSIVACVRHPLDTIASWKTSFAHLAGANLEIQLVGHSRDELMTGAQRRRLREIAATPHPALRRALMWRHLAELILENRHHLLVLRYESLVTQPMESLRRVFDSMPLMPKLKLPDHISPSAPRHKLEALDEDDLACIRGICAQTAAELGYERI